MTPTHYTVGTMVRLVALLFLSCSCLAVQAQTVVCLGDSLTAGVGAPPGSAYPDFLRKDLAAAGLHAVVVEEGVGGDTTRNGLTRLPAVLGEHPAVVVLELGVNDAFSNVPLPEIEHNLRTLIEAFQQAHIRVLLAGIDVPATLPFTPPPQLTTPYMRQFYALYPALAAQYHLPLIPFLLEGVYGVEGLMSSDYIHPNATGYEKVAATVLGPVQKLLAP